MITVKIKGGLRSKINLIEGQKAAIEGKTDFFTDLAKLINSSIQIRVQRNGEGTDGKKMKPYSDKYSRYKQNKGRNVNFRDLTFSGNMWQSLTAEKFSSGARLFFNSAENVNKARGNQARTPFFGVGKKEKDIINSELKKLIGGGA